MVQRLSAQLHLSIENRVPVNKNHTDMVKFASPVDPTYLSVVTHMKECIGAWYMRQGNTIEADIIKLDFPLIWRDFNSRLIISK